MSKKSRSEYEKDFYAWAVHNAKLLRAGELTDADIENIAEEIDSMGKSEKRELIARLGILIAHLLKWQYQPSRQGNSWKYTIKEQRLQLADLLEESPSLKSELENKINHAYEQAVVITLRETGLSENAFPKKCPFTVKQCLNQKFLPKSVS